MVECALAEDYFDRRTGAALYDPTLFWASEKYDGMRAIWTGKRLISRGGKVIYAPEWFKRMLPEGVGLDGELWMGRGNFEGSGAFRARRPSNLKWLRGTFRVFDWLGRDGHGEDLVFEERQERLQGVIRGCQRIWYDGVGDLPKHLTIPEKCPIRWARQVRIRSEAHFEKMYTAYLSAGAEGLMLRRAGSRWTADRSRDLLKCKPSFDAHATIIGYEMGHGRNTGRLGAFECLGIDIPGVEQQPEFKMSGMKDCVRNDYKSSHPIGTTVKFKYAGLVGDENKPRHPNYLRIVQELT